MDEAIRGGEGWGYALRSDEDETDFWGLARGAEGLFTPVGGDGSGGGNDAEEAPDAGLRRVVLTGCRPEGGLLKAVGRIGGRRAEAGNAWIDVLDPGGFPMGSYFVNGVTVAGVRPSARGAGLVDLTADLWCEAEPGSGAVWDMARAGGPDRTGLWRGLSTDGQWAWLSVALHSHEYRRRGKTEAPGGRTVTLDGRYVVDRNSFWCAIGEAVNGPLGYFGWNLDALNDCLYGGWGTACGFTLEWTDSVEARARLAEPGPSSDGEAPFFDVLMEIFEERRVTVVLK
ncbi:barstar family protein [Streptomyces sp. NPDC060198]|uniref:barstar family protein n=1 Tax=Streptomyces sp. NPDC060198 TaxID=3347070 RepID=UPI00365A4097